MPAYMKLTGIDGESQDKAHADEIDVLAWSWGESNAGSAAVGRGGGAAGKPNFQELTITKFVDRASTDLMLHCATGEHIPDGTLSVSRGAERPVDYIVVKMTDVIVTSVNVEDESPGDEKPVEEVTFNYSKIAFAYKLVGEDGNVLDTKEFGWDLVKNRPE